MAPPARASTLRVAAYSFGAALVAATAAAAAPVAVRQGVGAEDGVPLAVPMAAPAPPPSVGRNTIFPLAVTLDAEPNGNYTVPVNECIRTLSAQATGSSIEDWSLTTLLAPVATDDGRLRYSTRYTAALPTPPAGQPDVALEYARYVGRGGIDRDFGAEPACDGAGNLAVRLQTAAVAGVVPAAGTDPILPSTDASEASAVGSIVVAGPETDATPQPPTATVAPIIDNGGAVVPIPAPTTALPTETVVPTGTPAVVVPVLTPVVTPEATPEATPDVTPEATPEPSETPIAPVPVPAPTPVVEPVQTAEPEESLDPAVVGAAEVEAAEGEEDDGGSNLVPILIGCALAAAALLLAVCAVLTRPREGEPAEAAAAVMREAPPPPLAPIEVEPPLEAVPIVETGAEGGLSGGDVATGALATTAAGAGAVAAVPLMAGVTENPHDYQIGSGPVAPASPPPPAGYLTTADDVAFGAAGTTVTAPLAAVAASRDVDGIEGTTALAPVVPIEPVEGEQYMVAGSALPATMATTDNLPSAALPVAAGAAATGAVLAGKNSGSASSTDGTTPVTDYNGYEPTMAAGGTTYDPPEAPVYTAPEVPDLPEVPPVPVVAPPEVAKESFHPYKQPPQTGGISSLGVYTDNTAGATGDDLGLPTGAAPTTPTVDTFEVPAEAPAFPAAEDYGVGLEEPASFGGKRMGDLGLPAAAGAGAGGIMGGLASTQDTLSGAYESMSGSPGAAGGADQGLPVVDSMDFTGTRNGGETYGRR